LLNIRNNHEAKASQRGSFFSQQTAVILSIHRRMCSSRSELSNSPKSNCTNPVRNSKWFIVLNVRISSGRLKFYIWVKWIWVGILSKSFSIGILTEHRWIILIYSSKTNLHSSSKEDIPFTAEYKAVHNGLVHAIEPGTIIDDRINFPINHSNSLDLQVGDCRIVLINIIHLSRLLGGSAIVRIRELIIHSKIVLISDGVPLPRSFRNDIAQALLILLGVVESACLKIRSKTLVMMLTEQVASCTLLTVLCRQMLIKLSAWRSTIFSLTVGISNRSIGAGLKGMLSSKISGSSLQAM